jgi:hypothetical protein
MLLPCCAASRLSKKAYGTSEYLFLCARRKFGFNKKIGRSSLIVYVYYQPNSCTMYHTPADCGWAGETPLRQQNKVPPAHAQQVYC